MSDNYDFTMIVGEGCPYCAQAKSVLKDKIDSGKIKVMDVAKSKEALDLANKFNIDGVPSIIINNKATNIAEVCELKPDLSGVSCKDKDVDF